MFLFKFGKLLLCPSIDEEQYFWFHVFNKKGFHLNFCDNSCCIMLNDAFYAGGTLSNGIYILDMSNPILNINDSKRQKGDNLKSSYFMALSSWPYK